MLSMLIAYDVAGNVIATIDSMLAHDADGNVTGLYDFAAHEAAGGKLRDFGDQQGAVGSATWPEWIGGRAHDFTVELDGAKRIVALVHKESGHRRERADIEDKISKRIAKSKGEPVDIRDLVGGPNRALNLDDRGRTVARVRVERPDLPVIRAGIPEG